MANKVSDETAAKWESLLRDGKSMTDICKNHSEGYSAPTIWKSTANERRVLRELGRYTPGVGGRQSRLTRDDKLRILIDFTHHRKSFFVADIAAKYGISVSRVYQVVGKQTFHVGGVEVRKLTDEQKRQLWFECETRETKGVSLSDIARKYGISRQRVVVLYRQYKEQTRLEIEHRHELGRLEIVDQMLNVDYRSLEDVADALGIPVLEAQKLAAQLAEPDSSVQ